MSVYASNRQADLSAAQLGVMREQLNDSRAASFDAAVDEAMSVARQRQLLNTNAKLANAAAESSLLANRAWLSPMSGQSVSFTKDKAGYRATVNITNTGHTPAQRMRSRVFVDTISPFDERTYSFHANHVFSPGPGPCARFRGSEASQTVHPGQGLALHGTGAVVPGLAAFIQACIIYETMGQIRHLEICEYTLGFNAAGDRVPMDEATFSFCGNHNNAD